MATSLTPATVSKPLSDFQKIGHNTYLYTSEHYESAGGPLILMCSWNAAAAKHVAKYTVAYQRLFPDARILLIQCDTPDMFRRTETYQKLLAQAIGVVREHVKNGGEVLCHSFSNGGANQLVELAKAWSLEEGTLLPMRAQIIDSAPGKGEWMRTHAAITLSLPRSFFWRLFGSIAVHLVLVVIFLLDKLTGRENKILIIRRQLNDPAVFNVRTPRVYLYSKADQMVGYDEVEEHADVDSAKGWTVVKVRFENSPHAGHVREDEGRYWGAIMEAWNRGPSS